MGMRILRLVFDWVLSRKAKSGDLNDALVYLQDWSSAMVLRGTSRTSRLNRACSEGRSFTLEIGDQPSERCRGNPGCDRNRSARLGR